MKELIEQLKKLRQVEEFEKEIVKENQDILKSTEQWSNLQESEDNLRDTQAKIQQIDEQIREAALLEFAATGNKKPVGGVSVIITKRLNYLTDRAVQWAIHNAVEMVKINTRQFEKHAKAVSDTVPLEFVNISEEPSVRIAREL